MSAALQSTSLSNDHSIARCPVGVRFGGRTPGPSRLRQRERIDCFALTDGAAALRAREIKTNDLTAYASMDVYIGNTLCRTDSIKGRFEFRDCYVLSVLLRPSVRNTNHEANFLHITGT
jgi:hypothetical protein